MTRGVGEGFTRPHDWNGDGLSVVGGEEEICRSDPRSGEGSRCL